MDRNVYTRRPYILDREIADEIAQNGYAIVKLLDNEQLSKLRELYTATHQINKPGYFFSIFYNDMEYREQIFKRSNEIIQNSLQKLFGNYKIGYSGFVVRGPHDNSEFFVHQDPSFVDETCNAPLHIWCPLYDITTDFSPVCVIPKSHRLSAVYRSISVPSFFDSIRDDIRKYLKPLLIKAGDVILLDPRLIHNSGPNQRDVARPVLLVQMFPEGAPYFTPYLKNGEIEMYNLPENYFLSNTNFHKDVDDRPMVGTLCELRSYERYEISLEDFEKFCRGNDVYPTEYLKEKLTVSEGFIDPTV